MNISKEDFRYFMLYLQSEMIKEREINTIMCTSGYADCFHPLSTIIDKFIELLSRVTNDNNNWISYFIFELDFGAKWKSGMVSDSEGDVPLETIDDLYEMLNKYSNVSAE